MDAAPAAAGTALTERAAAREARGDTERGRRTSTLEAERLLRADVESDTLAWLQALPDVLRSRNSQFWSLQFLGFLAWGLLMITSGLYGGLQPSYNLAVLTGIFSGMLLTGLLREVYRSIWSRPAWVRLSMLALGSWVVAVLWQISKNVALVEFYGMHMPIGRVIGEGGWFDYTRGTLTSFYAILCWSGLYVGIKYYRMLNEERARALRAIASAREAQLRMLRYQLNPHFLFNTLNAISTLILEQDTQVANRMVTRLSSFLRHSLDSDPMQKVDLEQELRALRLYLDIEQVRFEERLRLEFDVSAAASRALVPSLLLQPLAENAIKYAVARSEDGGTIRIRADVVGDRLEIEVSDDGPGLPTDFRLDADGRGVGLRNTADRLEQVYGASHELKLLTAAPSGLRVLIRMPFETREDALR